MKHYRVKILGRAKREYAVANAWWRTYRHASPALLRDEFRAACELLARNPEAGRIDDSQKTDTRRLILPGVRYIVFYRIDHETREVQIGAFWHASREAPAL